MRRLSVSGLWMVLALTVCLAACTKAPSGSEKTETTKAAAETTAAPAADKSEETTAAAPAADKSEETAGAGQTAEESYNVEILIKDYGTIRVELDPTAAPETVDNFLQLVKKGFYDGLTFHRIIDGFMIQGGDPTGTGMGGSEKKIKGEFEQNGVKNPISHVRGTISMARSSDMNSASSQFFIVQSDSTYLDGGYAAFGTVTEGMEIVDKICKDTQVEDNNGTVKPANQPVIESIKVSE